MATLAQESQAVLLPSSFTKVILSPLKYLLLPLPRFQGICYRIVLSTMLLWRQFLWDLTYVGASLKVYTIYKFISMKLNH
jgi:hypothetical protein